MLLLAVVFRRGYRHIGGHTDIQTDIDDVSMVDNNQQETKTVQVGSYVCMFIELSNNEITMIYSLFTINVYIFISYE